MFCQLFGLWGQCLDDIIMPLILKKLMGLICLGLSVCPLHLHMIRNVKLGSCKDPSTFVRIRRYACDLGIIDNLIFVTCLFIYLFVFYF